MRLTKSGFKQVLHMRLTVDMRLITGVYGKQIIALIMCMIQKLVNFSLHTTK